MPSACASSPCINDGTCEESCMDGTGFKCVCIDGRMGDKCQNWTSKWEISHLAAHLGMLLKVT